MRNRWAARAASRLRASTTFAALQSVFAVSLRMVADASGRTGSSSSRRSAFAVNSRSMASGSGLEPLVKVGGYTLQQ